MIALAIECFTNHATAVPRHGIRPYVLINDLLISWTVSRHHFNVRPVARFFSCIDSASEGRKI